MSRFASILTSRCTQDAPYINEHCSCPVCLDAFHLVQRYGTAADTKSPHLAEFLQKLSAAVFGGDEVMKRLDDGEVMASRVDEVIAEFANRRDRGCTVYTDDLKRTHEVNRTHIVHCLAEPASVTDDEVLVKDRFGRKTLLRGGGRVECLWRHLHERFQLMTGVVTANLLTPLILGTYNLDREVMHRSDWPYLPLHIQAASYCSRATELELLQGLQPHFPPLPMVDPSDVNTLGFQQYANSIWDGLNVPHPKNPLPASVVALASEWVETTVAESRMFNSLNEYVRDVLLPRVLAVGMSHNHPFARPFATRCYPNCAVFVSHVLS